MSSANAINSPQGGIAYKNTRTDAYSSLIDDAFYMDENIQIQESMHLKARESKDVPVTNTAPNVEGTALGGLLFEQKTEQDKIINNKKDDISLTGKIKLTQAIAVKLNLSDPVNIQYLKINDADNQVYPTGAYVNFVLENPNAAVIENISFKY